MEAIPRLIYNLLASRQTVILPGLGTLRVYRIPAAIDAAGGKITVPENRIAYSPTAESGKTLPEIIAGQSGVDLKEIKPQYNRWVANVRRGSIDGQIAVEGVGMLIRQPDGSFRVEIAPELYRWLNPVGQKTVPLPTPVPKAKAPKTGSRRSKLVRRAAWLATLGAVLAVLIYGGYFGYTRGWFKKAEPVRQETPVIPVQTAEPQPVSVEADSTATEVQDIPVVTVPAPVSTPAQIIPGEVYHIIAGVFSNRENAERYVRDGGFEASKPTLIPTTGGRFMVSIGKFGTKEAADAEVKRIQDRVPSAWVSKRKE